MSNVPVYYLSRNQARQGHFREPSQEIARMVSLPPCLPLKPSCVIYWKSCASQVRARCCAFTVEWDSCPSSWRLELESPCLTASGCDSLILLVCVRSLSSLVMVTRFLCLSNRRRLFDPASFPFLASNAPAVTLLSFCLNSELLAMILAEDWQS